MPYYFDIESLRCHEVVVLGSILSFRKGVELVSIHDKDMSPDRDYVVSAAMVCDTQELAIAAAKEDLIAYDDQAIRQIRYYQNRHEQIDKLLAGLP